MTIVGAKEIEEEIPVFSLPIASFKNLPPVPRSNPMQLVAGLSDIGTSIPTFAGLAIGVGEGIGKTLSRPRDPETGKLLPISLVKNVVEAFSSGVDRDLIDTGLAAREAVNEFLGTPEPKLPGDQVLRLLGGFAPIPVPRLPPGSSLLARSLANTANILTPAVKAGPGFGTRAGAQLGIGGIVDQTVRALSADPEFPTIFAPNPGEPTVVDDDPNFDSLIPDFDDAFSLLVSRAEAGEIVDAGEIETGSTILPDTTPQSEKLVVDEFDIEDEPKGRIRALEQLNNQIEEEEESNLLRNYAIAAASIFAVFIGAKFSKKLAEKKILSITGLDPIKRGEDLRDAANIVRRGTIVGANDPNQKGLTKITKGIRAGITETQRIAKSKAARLGGTSIDKTEHNEQQLRGVGTSEKVIREITGQELVDTPGVVRQFLRTGKFGQGSPTQVRSLFSIMRQFGRLTPERKQAFIDGVAFRQEDIARIRGTAFDALAKDKEGALVGLREAFETGTVSDVDLILKEQADFIAAIRGTTARERPGLFNIVERRIQLKAGVQLKQEKVFIEDLQLLAGLKKFEADAEFVQIEKALAKINEVVLQEAVRRGVGDDAWAKAITKQFTMDGRAMYIPGKTNLARSAWYKRLAVNLGFHTTHGKTLEGVANWHKQGLVEGTGIRNRVDPFTATADYSLQIMMHTDKSVKQWNILSRLTGLSIDGSGNVTIVPPKVDDLLTPSKYIGSSDMDDPLNQAGQIHVKFNKEDATIVERFGTTEGATFTPEQLAKMDDAIWVQRGSTWHGFLVQDAQFKKGLEFDAALHNRVLKFGNFWKNTFTQNTTGIATPFALTSQIYNQQISTVNAALRATAGPDATLKTVSKEALAVWTDAYKGAYEIFSTRLAEDFSDLLGDALKRRDIYKQNPELLRKAQVILKRKVRRSLLNAIQQDTGKTASSLAAREFQGNLTDVLEEAVPFISQKWGYNVLPQIWRIWEHVNTALHEGSAVGIAMRKAQKEAILNPKASRANINRQAQRDANALVGDVRQRGSSDTAKAFHAVTPFSGAMLQAWITTGRALKVAGIQKGIGTLTAAVGLPVISEIIWNSTLDGEETWKVDSADPNGKEWNYRDYYWNGFTAEQRNNNIIMMIPGKPPWEAFIRPITPELSLFRGVIIDSIDALGAFSVSGLDTGNQTLAGFVRMVDFPVNPFLAALASSMNIDLRAGVIPDDTAGKGFSFISGRQLNTGARANASGDFIRFHGDEMSNIAANIVKDILGANGNMLVAFANGLGAGDEATTTEKRLEFAFDELGRNIRQRASPITSIWAQALRPKPDRDVARDLVSKRNALQRFQKQQENINTGGVESLHVVIL